MKRLTSLWQVQAEELGRWCSVDPSRDCTTLEDRVEHEGFSFLTITLPSFSSDFEKALDQQRVTPDLFAGFRRQKGSCLPAFLQGFTGLVFDSGTGIIKSSPDATAVFAVRQLCQLFKKVELECTEQRNAAAVQDYLACEDTLKEADRDPKFLDPNFRRFFATLYGPVLDRLERNVSSFDLQPKHGPGKTADRLEGNQKYCQTHWPERLESVFPFGEYVLPSWRHYAEYQPEYVSPKDELPVKVTLVPKTQKAPRIIAVEPTAMQYAQQAVMTSLVPLLERDEIVGPMLGFTDAEPNQRMAKQGSIARNLATLDLKEASDRVLNSLVLFLFEWWPNVSEALQASRSRTALLPDGTKIRLSKFASMGSALCFPVESMVFLAVTLYGIAGHVRNRPRNALKAFHGSVRVFGDDIIAPNHLAARVIETLESFHFKVNTTKSFAHGYFRESCGADWFQGKPVKPIRLKRLLPGSRADVEELIGAVAFMNSCYARGLWDTAAWMLMVLADCIGPLPKVDPSSQALGRHFGIPSGKLRWNPNLHRTEVKALVPKSKSPECEISEVWALRKTLAHDWSDPAYKEHLLYSGRPHAVNLKREWVPTGA